MSGKSNVNRSRYEDRYSLDEVARAAGLPPRHLRRLLQASAITPGPRGFDEVTAVDLVRALKQGGGSRTPRQPFSTLSSRRGRAGVPLAASALLHAAMLGLILLLSSLGLLTGPETAALTPPSPPAHLVFLLTPGPGGGGGGGGLQAPLPPPPAERKAPAPKPKKVASPVPPVRRPAPPPRRPEIPAPRPEVARPVPLPLPPPALPQAVEAPVAMIPASSRDVLGTLAAPPAPPSDGPGTGGGVGSGAGTGIGEGAGSGVGPGSGGGAGGGPYLPGSGIEPPTLVREVHPSYTEQARRQEVEGDVILSIVVRRDGSVGDVRLVRSLGAGLDQKAVEAVRQWRFGAARRHGSPIDVVVEVSVEFRLR